MRVLFVSGELIAGGIAYKLQEEGCEVKLYVEHSDQQECLDGFLEKVSDWKKELDWVGKDGLIVFDDVGYGKIQDDLRAEGYRVVGGSEIGDRLERERGYGSVIMKLCGIDVIPIHDFATIDEAIKFIEDNPRYWVAKQNTHQSALNYIGVFPDGSDVINVLNFYKKAGIKSIALQEKINGIEIAVGRYFNGEDWVGSFEINIEHKNLCNDDVGPKTGEMGTLLWYCNDENNKLFQSTLAKLKPYLQKIKYKGDIDINLFVCEDKVFPIEITARFGCPTTYLQSTMHKSSWSDLLNAVADGKKFDLEYHEGYGVALTLALPPFPFSGKLDREYSSEGMEVLFKTKLSEEEKSRLYFEGVRYDAKDDSYKVTKNLGYTIFITGRGDTVEKARKSAYDLVEKIILPKSFYRTDIGVKFMNKDEALLKKWGWI